MEGLQRMLREHRKVGMEAKKYGPQSSPVFTHPEKGGKGTGSGSEQYKFVCLEVPAKGRQ